MIVSVSRRTDIPAFYSEWFFNRVREGFAVVRNPFNPHALSKVSLRPEDAECLVFWTKNPAPMLPRLHELSGYHYYFQFTLNAYGKEIEPCLPPLDERIETFQKLSQAVGKERVIWRYDPILLNERYTPSWHAARFAYLAKHLSGSACVLSFIDVYSKIKKNLALLGVGEMTAAEKSSVAAKILEIAQDNGVRLQTCAEDTDLPGIAHGSCIDPLLISKLLGCEINAEKDRNQRQACGCASSVDIGAYNTCLHGCAYCYANDGRETMNFGEHHQNAPVLTGEITTDDAVAERTVKRVATGQTSLFQ